MANLDQRGAKNHTWRGGKSKLVCETCGREFLDYHRANGRERKYCSAACGYGAKSNKVEKICPECGKTFVAHIEAIYCSKRCSGAVKGRMGKGRPKSEEHRKNLGLSHLREKNHYWKGGTKEQSGYRMVIRDRATPTGMRYVMEHRQIAEKALGRPLKFSEVVHHINGCKSDNRNANLLICDKAYHGWLHRTMSRRYQNEHFHIPSDFIESGASLVDA